MGLRAVRGVCGWVGGWFRGQADESLDRNGVSTELVLS